MTDIKTKPETMENIHRRISSSMDLRSLARQEGAYAKDRGNIRMSSLCSDSRRVTPGAAFFALPGLRTHGNEHLREAIERGARVVITDSETDTLPSHVVKVKVDDARTALAKFSKRYHGNPDELLKLIGITGTNGKTTVTSLTRHLLEEPGRPVGLIGTVKYHLGDRELPSYRTTPEASDLYPLLKSMLVGGCSEAVMEVSSHGIHQSRVAGLQLEIAAFLNLSRDHLDYHKTMEAYFKEKRKIFNGVNGSLPQVAVVNGDCPYGKRLLDELPPQVRFISFGFEEGCLFRAIQISLDANGAKFVLESPAGNIVVNSPLVGRYNIMNVLASFAIIYGMGRSVPDAVQKLAGFNGVDGRMEVIDQGQVFKVVVDYAHTPDALRNALGMLRECTKGKLHLVFGCGGDRDRGKRLEMTRVACAGADRIWATADNPRTEPQSSIFDDMKKGVSRGAKVAFIEDRRRAINRAFDAAGPEDCVLIAGKGHEAFQEIQYSAIPFDDRRIAEDLIQAKIFSH